MDTFADGARKPNAGQMSTLLPLMAFVLVAYLVIGVGMPVVPLYVRQGLGLSNLMVGVVAGVPFAAALISRFAAGRFVDGVGAKPSVVVGMFAAIGAGLFFLASAASQYVGSVALIGLLLGRTLLGAADSFIITGALSWGIRLLGAEHTGKVMAWVGTALYAAFALGAPLGSVLYGDHGFSAVAIATLLFPLFGLAIVAPMSSASPSMKGERSTTTFVVRAVLQPGIALALTGVGFGAMTTFLSLLFVQHGWSPAWSAFTALSVAFILGRLLFGDVADRAGGARVALVCVLVEAAGLFCIWLAPSMPVALAGVALSGFGYSLVYPGLGVEAVRRAPEQSRGSAMGVYTAFLDFSLGASSPVLGAIAGWRGIDAVYLVSAVVALAAVALILRLSRRPNIA